MAVNIKVPGVGIVSADNAATESTLRALLQAMTASQGRQRRADSEIAAATRQQAGYADRAADSLGQVAANAKTSESASRGLFNTLQESMNRVSIAGSDIKDSGAATYLKQLGATAVEVSALWAKNFGELPTNPVKKAQSLLSTGVSAAVEGAAGVAKTLFPLIPDKLVKTGEKLVQTGLQSVVGMMSDELNSTIKAYSEFNKMGASFTDGMTSIRRSSGFAGLTVDQFTASMVKVQPQLKAMGLTTAGAADYASRVAFEFGQIKNGGRTLREELRGLGYSTEEQVELAAQYSASLRATMSQEKFNNYDKKQLAQETRAYAENLKVLRDITGQDAKAAQERARAEVQRAGLLNKLGPEQKAAFTEANRVVQKLPANIQNAIMARIMGQPVTDATVASSQEMMGLVENISQVVLSGRKDAQRATLEEIATAQKNIKAQAELGQGYYALADQLTVLGVGGITADIAKTANALILDPITQDQIEKSYANAGRNAQLTDKLTGNVIKFQGKVQDYAVTISQQLGPYLADFTEVLEQMTAAMNDFVFNQIRLFTGKTPPKDSQPGTEPTEKYTPAQYKADMAQLYIKYIQPVLEKVDSLITVLGGAAPGHALGGIARGPASGFLSLLHGTEAVVPLPDGRSIPVELSGAGANLTNTMQQMQSSFLAVAAAKSSQSSTQVQPDPSIKDTVQELPTALSSALETVLSGPSGLVQTMSQVKNQIADDNKMQMSMMQQQIESLTKLVDAMQDNVKYSERLANELA